MIVICTIIYIFTKCLTCIFLSDRFSFILLVTNKPSDRFLLERKTEYKRGKTERIQFFERKTKEIKCAFRFSQQNVFVDHRSSLNSIIPMASGISIATDNRLMVGSLFTQLCLQMHSLLSCGLFLSRAPGAFASTFHCVCLMTKAESAPRERVSVDC